MSRVLCCLEGFPLRAAEVLAAPGKRRTCRLKRREGSLKPVPEGAWEDHPYVRNARSKIDLLKAWAEETKRPEYTVFADELLKKIGGMIK